MLNFRTTKINLIGIIDTISSITKEPTIMVHCNSLRELLELRDDFEVFDFCCREVGSWYFDNIEFLITNDYPNNEMIHHKNIQTLTKIINDIDLFQEEYRAYMKVDGTIDKLMGKEEISSPIEKNKVFIVHGRDLDKVDSVARFLTSIGVEPVILHEQVSGGSTLIEKIEKSTNVGYAIAIYSPCDIGALSIDSKNMKQRARQNVVFEHGYLLAKLGRQNVCALVVKDVETPTDIAGLIYIPFDDQKSWRFEIGKELQNSGYTVDWSQL